VRRITFALAITAVALFATAAPVWAHVSVSPEEAPKGGFATLTFQVPNERDDATTNKVEVQFPQDHPIAEASVQPIPGWSVEVTKKKLPAPIKTDEGETLDEGVNTVTWTADDKKGLGEGEFQQFTVSVALPDDTDSLAFPAIQTYSDGETANWTEETPAGGPEPEHPRPEVKLVASGDHDTTPTTAATAAGSDDGASQDDVDSAKTLGIVGIVIGALGLAAGIGGFAMRRRTS
jgi:uncharacterized protein YcnI